MTTAIRVSVRLSAPGLSDDPGLAEGIHAAALWNSFRVANANVVEQFDFQMRRDASSQLLRLTFPRSDYSTREMVDLIGIKPTTSSLRTKRSIN